MTQNGNQEDTKVKRNEFLRFLAIVNLLSVLTGCLVALFLWALDLVTQFHWSRPGLLFALPIAGVLSWSMYRMINKTADGGNTLLFQRIRHPNEQPSIPVEMAPLVLLGTLITHLFGGSAGREGTAVQMGGSLAGWLGAFVTKKVEWQRSLLLCGISAGFGAVFGTPIAGAVFALEVVWLGRNRLFNIVPCLLSAFLAHHVVMWWGIEHSVFHLPSLAPGASTFSDATPAPAFSIFALASWFKVLAASVLFGLIAILFTETTHGVNRLLKRSVSRPWLRPVIGGCVLIVLTMSLGSRDYLGIGVEANPSQERTVCITSSFSPGGVDHFSWLWKLLSTSITVGSGFKGGEVTPLFFVGATAGNAISHWMDFPVDLLAAIGFVAVFAGATKTPTACVFMAIELFAPHNPELITSGFILHLAMGCFIARFASGRSSIYYHSGNATAAPYTETVKASEG